MAAFEEWLWAVVQRAVGKIHEPNLSGFSQIRLDFG
jgi:hypothetical protein